LSHPRVSKHIIRENILKYNDMSLPFLCPLGRAVESLNREGSEESFQQIKRL